MDLLSYIVLVAGWWCWSVLFFLLVQKPVFGVYNSSPGVRKWREAPAVYRHGVMSDMIVGSYLSVIPLFSGLAAVYVPGDWLRILLGVYGSVAGLAVGLISIGDTGLYKFWNSKIDASVFPYLRHPKGAFASVSAAYVATGLLSVVFVAVIYAAGALGIAEIAEVVRQSVDASLWQKVAAPVACLLFAGLFAVIIRGLGIRPNNPSLVYYSPVAFFNHWALNPAYSMIYSLGTRDEFKGRFRFFDDAECEDILKPLFPASGAPEEKLLKTDRPNILVVVWESFGGDFCGPIGGNPEITPNFNSLCKEGVFFSNCRAASFRTDRALPAIFCGLPAQPTTSIIRYTRKIAHLPAFPADLRELGYSTTAVHGGDLSIMHKSDFYLSTGHTRLVAQKDFPQGLPTVKWGIHDGPVLEHVADEILGLDHTCAPWLYSVQTLSSHEPFDVPYARLENKAENSMAYTDAALGKLVGKLKGTPAWENLLLIVVADHGLNDGRFEVSKETYSHIPMLWAGGAVKGPKEVSVHMSQCDLPATLLGQLGLPHDRYGFSRDVLSPGYREPSSLHVFPNGFLFTDSTGVTDYDTISETATPGSADAGRERRGKAILQKLYEYLEKL